MAVPKGGSGDALAAAAVPVARCTLYDNLPPLSAAADEMLERELADLSSAQKVFLVARLLGLSPASNSKVCVGSRLDAIIGQLVRINFSRVHASPVQDVDAALREAGLHLGDLVAELRSDWVG